MRAARALALLLAGALAGCSGGSADIRETEDGASTAVQLGGLVGQALRTRRAEREPLTVTREELAAAGVTQPFLVARLEDGTAAGLFPAGSNRGFILWRTADGIGLTGRGGVLAGTQGLGADLLSAETEPLVRALAAGRSARYRRVLRRLDGEDRLLVQPYDCVLTLGPPGRVVVLGRAHPVRRSTEACRPVEPSDPALPAPYRAEPFTNTYDVGDGTIWVSRQYVGPAVGHLVLERVIE